MRIPLAAAGIREMAAMTLLFGGGAAAAYFGVATGHAWCWAVAISLTAVWAFGMAFFRDPERAIPQDPGVLVSPADGKIVEVAKLDRHDLIGGPATRISIFLSVFNVHINRSPCAGVVRSIRYQHGQYLDARDPQSGALNESNTLIIDPMSPHEGPVVVRQIAGLIARRIVCYVKEGQRVEAGQRIGLIKFGSRTELIVPGHDAYVPAVREGEPVAGAATVLARHAASSGASSREAALAGSGDHV